MVLHLTGLPHSGTYVDLFVPSPVRYCGDGLQVARVRRTYNTPLFNLEETIGVSDLNIRRQERPQRLSRATFFLFTFDAGIL